VRGCLWRRRAAVYARCLCCLVASIAAGLRALASAHAMHIDDAGGAVDALVLCPGP
jgi:hypothetical protein